MKHRIKELIVETYPRVQGYVPTAAIPVAVRKLIVQNHDRVAGSFSDTHLPYRTQCGRIYLNVRESPMMLARALRVYEEHQFQLVCHLLKPGMTFVDVGVNKGDFSLLAARLVGRRGRVLAFEPEPENCNWIRRSIAINGYQNITLREIALSDAEGSAQLYLGQKSGFHTLLSSRPGSSGECVEVPTRSLDAVLKESGTMRVDMMKIDVEGAELKVLRGARECLRQNPQVVLTMDLHPHLGVDTREVCSFLQESGFTVYKPGRPYKEVSGDDARITEVLARRTASP